MKKLIVFLLFQCTVQSLFPCTTFFLKKNGQYVFGRNYDWVTGVGVVHTNLRGLGKSSFLSDKTDTLYWISKYGSITFNQYGKEFPTGGMNEKGLVVELMWLDETKYPAEDSRPSIGELQWIQYQLDNSATVEELIASDKKLRIGVKANAPLHFLAADANGDVATIEFLSGRMIVHKGQELDFPVLTNTVYEESINQIKRIDITDKSFPFFSDNSIQRFAKACSMINRFYEKDIKTSLVDYSFGILEQVAQTNYTKWSIVYDISNKRIFFKTNNFLQIKSFEFSAFDLSCSASPMSFNMNQNFQGNINEYFENFSNALNRKFLEKAIHESLVQVTISASRKEAMIKYADLVHCQK
jgi:penicillin V acylase-like amidase (Ntn superfamily)